MKLLTLPNVISLSRVPLAAAFVLTDTTTGRVIIVAAVALSDLADGFAARHTISHDGKVGALVDPIADKLFVVVALIALLVRRELSAVQLLVLLARDVFTTIAYVVLRRLRWSFDFKARITGKIVTVLQFASVMAVLFWRGAFPTLLVVTAVASILAVADYSHVALRARRNALATTPTQA
ncbi:MAG TPA: CDP-alcohol phosphatidyltransferase family protein [Longimicrobiales bacterium]|nr:CDP-alcohol phosphatidyltransferase family protein [Longimicrobiales bacterium]